MEFFERDNKKNMDFKSCSDLCQQAQKPMSFCRLTSNVVISFHTEEFPILASPSIEIFSISCALKQNLYPP